MSSSVADMGRMSVSGSPVVRASRNTTTDSKASTTSDWATRVTMKRVMSPATASWALLPRDHLVEVELVHDAAGIPLGDALGRHVRRVEVHEWHAEVLAAQAHEDLAHERPDLFLVGLAHDLGHHPIQLGVVDRRR